jgi:hypothetical protein
METILSAKLVAEPVEKDREPAPEKLEVVTEKIVTETRTYEREFLEKQKAQITQDKIDYAAARDLELEQIESLLKQFGTLTAIKTEEVISGKP